MRARGIIVGYINNSNNNNNINSNIFKIAIIIDNDIGEDNDDGDNDDEIDN